MGAKTLALEPSGASYKPRSGESDRATAVGCVGCGWLGLHPYVTNSGAHPGRQKAKVNTLSLRGCRGGRSHLWVLVAAGSRQWECGVSQVAVWVHDGKKFNGIDEDFRAPRWISQASILTCFVVFQGSVRCIDEELVHFWDLIDTLCEQRQESHFQFGAVLHFTATN